MKPTQTGIAVAVALVVIALLFIYPSFSQLIPSNQESSSALIDTTSTSPNQDPSTTMQQDSNEPVTQLQITDTAVGTGATAAAGDTVTVNYVGALTNGKVFDASANQGTQGFTFPLGAGQVIKGWDQGVAGMRVGGRRHLVIPAALAYGDQEVGGGVIPANSTLVFDVELLKVQKGGQ